MNYKLTVYFLDIEQPNTSYLRTKDDLIQRLIELNYLGNVEQISYEKVR